MSKVIKLGHISGVFGIKGWVKVYSYTEVKENILNYSPWLLQKGHDSKAFELIDGAVQGKAIVAKLRDVNDRDQAFALIGFDIFITSEQLPKAATGEYYWSELVGLKVQTVTGVALGVVDFIMQTGANDVLIVQGDKERAIPFLQPQVIVTVDVAGGFIVVDWDPDF